MHGRPFLENIVTKNPNKYIKNTSFVYRTNFMYCFQILMNAAQALIHVTQMHVVQTILALTAGIVTPATLETVA